MERHHTRDDCYVILFTARGMCIWNHSCERDFFYFTTVAGSKWNFEMIFKVTLKFLKISIGYRKIKIIKYYIWKSEFFFPSEEYKKCTIRGISIFENFDIGTLVVEYDNKKSIRIVFIQCNKQDQSIFIVQHSLFWFSIFVKHE